MTTEAGTAALAELVEKWRADADEIEADGDWCCAQTRRHDADVVEAVLRAAGRSAPEPPKGDDLMKPTIEDAAEMLWVVLANVSGGDWTQQSPEWQEAAARWRDNYFAAISKGTEPAPESPHER